MSAFDITAWKQAWEAYDASGRPVNGFFQWVADHSPLFSGPTVAAVMVFGLILFFSAARFEPDEGRRVFGVIVSMGLFFMAVGALLLCIGQTSGIWMRPTAPEPPSLGVMTEQAYGVTDLDVADCDPDNTRWSSTDGFTRIRHDVFDTRSCGAGEHEASYHTPTRIVRTGTLVIDGDSIILTLPDGTMLTPKTTNR